MSEGMIERVARVIARNIPQDSGETEYSAADLVETARAVLTAMRDDTPSPHMLRRMMEEHAKAGVEMAHVPEPHRWNGIISETWRAGIDAALEDGR